MCRLGLGHCLSSVFLRREGRQGSLSFLVLEGTWEACLQVLASFTEK